MKTDWKIGDLFTYDHFGRAVSNYDSETNKLYMPIHDKLCVVHLVYREGVEFRRLPKGRRLYSAWFEEMREAIEVLM